MNCPKCGYDLTGLPQNRCPECGSPFEPSTLGKQPAAKLHAAFRQAGWSKAARVSMHACLSPTFAIGPDASLQADVAHVGRQLLGWSLLWHLVVLATVLLLGAAAGISLGVWQATTLPDLAFYLIDNAFTLMFDVLIWLFLGAAVAVVALRMWSPRGSTSNQFHLAAAFFAFSVAGEAAGRGIHLLASLPLALLHIHVDPWPYCRLLGYGVFATMTLIALLRLRPGRSVVPFAFLIAAALGGWCLERAAWTSWFHYVERPFLRALGLW